MVRVEASLVVLALALAGCDRAFSLDRPPVDVLQPDAKVIETPFGAPEPISLNTPGEDDRPTLTADMLELYFHGDGMIYRSVRQTVDEAWPTREPVDELNMGDVRRPCLAGNGLTIYFSKGLAGSQFDIYSATRPDRTTRWSEPVALPAPINRPSSSEFCGWPSADGLVFLFTSNFLAGGDNDVFRATRATTAEPFQVFEFSELNSPSADGAPWAIASGTTVMLDTGRDRPSQDIVEAVQDGLAWRFTEHPELATPAHEGSVWLSPDGRVLYFSSNRDGNDDIYVATRGD